MNQWPTKSLGDVAEIAAGSPAPQPQEDFTDGGTPFVRMQDVGRFGTTTSLQDTRDKLAPAVSKSLRQFPAGAILIPKSGASIRLNHRAILGIEAHVVSHLAVIMPDNRLLDRLYAYYWLCNTDLSKVAHQADLPSIKLSDIASLKIPLPPIELQSRIGALLFEADELRKLRVKADQRTADLIPALFHEMFGRPSEWPRQKFRDLLAEPLRNGLSPAKAGTHLGKVLTLSAITGKAFSAASCKDALFARLPDNNSKVSEDLFLICRGNGNKELVGRAKFPSMTRGNLVFPDTMIAATANPVRILRDFLEVVWALPETREQILSGARTTNGTWKINQTTIEEISLPIPPLSYQKKFADCVREIHVLEADQNASRLKLEALFQSLLHRAFNGAL